MAAFTLPTRYQLEPIVLGGGGMSDTVVCRDTHLDRLVVVKSLKSSTDRKRILDEIAALQLIRSKHVVQIYDIVVDDKGRPAGVVEEYLQGTELAAAPPPTSEQSLLKLIYPVAEGIADIHGHGVVHRDIKPNNMKYDSENCLKIFDFGLARLTGPASSTNAIVGTRGYIAPELFVRGSTGRIQFTEAIDTFAFAATVLKLTSGAIPKELHATPPRLPSSSVTFGSLPFTLQPELQSLLNRCFDVVPSNRPSMGIVRDILSRHLLRDKHRALLVYGTSIHWLHANNRVANLSARSLGSLTITYDGLQFVISNVTGAVSLNNMPVVDGHIIEGSCVLVLGTASAGHRRVFVTVDISHPESTL